MPEKYPNYSLKNGSKLEFFSTDESDNLRGPRHDIMLDMVDISTPEGLVEMARQRDLAETEFLYQLKDVDQKAEKWFDHGQSVKGR